MKTITELRKRFSEADPDFGPLPFWWWSAEEITAERIRWQLQKFRDGGLRNIGIINIAPTGPQYGSVSDNPVHFSERWWAMFEVALREAERLGMRLYFYDQIGFSGMNIPARMVTENSAYAAYGLRRLELSEPLPDGATPLLEADGYRYYTVRYGFNWLDPQATAALMQQVHGEFERRFPQDLGRTLGGSFQDELPPLPMWTAELPERYLRKHGEALLPLLPLLFDERPGSAAVRRRVYKLAAELAEEALFIPLAKWHGQYDMLLCCDQAGPARRADVHGAQRLYLDYFRTHRWYSAAGSDMDGEIKPHSSMVHLHGGKRVFLEAFHTSGWGGTLEETLHWLIPWLQAGATLYSPHSVYYSTRGGWWEWAPPDTGWRQPYYEHYAVFADTIARTCSLLSEGAHVADIAVHYPSYAVCGYMSLDDGGALEHPMVVANQMPHEALKHIHETYVRLTGRWGRKEQRNLGALREAFYDYDIVDDSALEKSRVEEGKLVIADERFSVLLLCGATEMDERARERTEAWIKQGGRVIVVDALADQPSLAGATYAATAEEAMALITDLVPRRVEGPGTSLHRRTADADVFLLLPKDGELLRMHEPATAQSRLSSSSVYRLRTSGAPQLWDPVSGEVQPAEYKRDGEWVEVDVPFHAWPAALVVCPKEELSEASLPERTMDSPVVRGPARVRPNFPIRSAQELKPDGWKVRAVSTLDNRYGDFDLHGEPCAYVPIETRQVRVRRESAEGAGEQAGWHLSAYDDSGWKRRLWSEADYWRASKGESFLPEQAWPVTYSRILGDMSFQTWAGRMGRVPRRFLNLGHLEAGEAVCAATEVIAPAEGTYWIRLESNARIDGTVEGQAIAWSGGPEEQTARIHLKAGANALLLRARAIVGGKIRAAVEVNVEARPPLPKWIMAKSPAPESALLKTICAGEGAARRVVMLFAAKGRARLLVNGQQVIEHGDFNPYIRQGQEELDLTPYWREGDNDIRFELPEGVGEVFADGFVELASGERFDFCTGDDWLDDRGHAPDIKHEAVLQFAETESLWMTDRPHPLPGVGWLMPNSAPKPEPLRFQCDYAEADKAIWLRYTLPAGAMAMKLSCDGTAKVWIDGIEVAVRNGRAEFPPQPAHACAAVRIEPAGPCSDADILTAPIRYETAPAQGVLGDWRSALNLPHYSGAVEYETTVELKGTAEAVLELGHVRGTAECWLGGRPLGVRAWGPYRFDLGEGFPPGVYTLRIRVTNTLGTHYEVGRPSANVGGSTDPKVTYWEPGISPDVQDVFSSGGLYGPVRLLEA
ncbi:hypothetical protein [Cohnella boryungensis]|uniref:Alpha-L-rhamnosidase-like protein n=1 Tax=Cohnella boryungensis TaxID=768479 RepID=A0ABV8SIT7_9BACL